MLLVRSSEGGWDDWAWQWIMRNAYRILVGKPEGKRPRWRHRRRWEYNIRMDLKEIGWEGVDWMHLAQDRRALVNTVMNLLRIPLKAGNFLTSWLCRWSFHNLSNTFPNPADVHRILFKIFKAANLFEVSTWYPDLLWGPPSLQFNGYRVLFPRDKAAVGVKPTTYLHLIPTLRMRGSIPPFPYVFIAWCSVKNSDKFTFTFTILKRYGARGNSV
jgi:hypothetical protein